MAPNPANTPALSDSRENEIAFQREQIAFLNKEIEALTYSVSHDLRTPLRGIIGLSQAVLEDYGDRLDAQGKDFLSRIHDRAQLMGRLIDNILHLSRLSRKEMAVETVNLSEICKEAARSLRRKHPEVPVELSIQDHIHAAGDAEMLKVVFSGLLENAWKSIGASQRGKIRFCEKKIYNLPTYILHDNGAGIDQNDADRIFETLQITRQNNGEENAGVSLAVVKRIIHRHQGNIWINRKRKKTSTVYFTLFPFLAAAVPSKVSA